MEKRENIYNPHFLNGNIQSVLIAFNEWLSKEPINKPNSNEVKALLNTIRETMNRAEEYVNTNRMNNRDLNRFCEESKILHFHFGSIMSKNIVQNDYSDDYIFYRRVDDKLLENKPNKYPQQLDKFESIVFKSEIENDFPEIFKDSFSYSLFLKMHKIYHQNKNLLANYSFLYYALDKDKFLVCSGSDFVKFLNEKVDVNIDKIDSRQTGTNKKTSLYNSTKENLLSKN